MSMEPMATCVLCGENFAESQSIYLDDDCLCPTCAEERTVLCAQCGERIYSDDNAGDARIPLCESCYDRSYVTCNDCGRVIHLDDIYYAETDEDDDTPLCYDCYTRSSLERVIHDYNYKPEPLFYGEGPRYYGIELELDNGGEIRKKAASLLEVSQSNGAETLYCKHDGSLNDGFELVTHPMALNYHKQEMPWQAILQKCVELGYSSHQAGTCGLHIHVSRSAFGVLEEQQDACIARILYFFEKNWEELLKFSRRTALQLERWAARYGYKEQPMDILDHAKKGYHGGRYTCVNLRNHDTIEFRMFRGTLKYNTLIATLQMVDRICDMALSLSDEELKAMSWTTFVSDCHQPELVQYLKERRLYVNEPVESEVEL